MQDREHEPQVDRDRRLPREQRLDPLLDREVLRVDLVVERDHLVGELGVLLRAARSSAPRSERRTSSPSSCSDRLEAVELLLEAYAIARSAIAQPNRPVT